VSGSNIFAGTASGVFLSANNGQNWMAVNFGLPESEVLSLAVNGSTIFAGTYEDSVFRSTNNGTTWTAVGLPNYLVSSLAASDGKIFAGVLNGGVFRSTDNGTTWTAVDSGLTNTKVYSLLASGSNIFAGTGGGVFLSTNNGTSWTAVNSGLVSIESGTTLTAIYAFLTDTTVLSLAVSDSTIFAGTGGGGVWRRPLAEMIGVVNDKPKQGVSKPYASGFKINIGKNGIAVLLPETVNNGAVTVELVNIAGRRIYSATHQACNGILNIPVLGLSTGTYLMSIRGNNTTMSSRFVVTK
jgi:ligand-binding sensor domain-containing protein